MKVSLIDLPIFFMALFFFFLFCVALVLFSMLLACADSGKIYILIHKSIYAHQSRFLRNASRQSISHRLSRKQIM